MPEHLLNRLWTVVRARFGFWTEEDLLGIRQPGKVIFTIWDRFYRLPSDALPLRAEHALAAIRERFFGQRWHDVYDLLELIDELDPIDRPGRATFAERINQVLEQELAAWRFVGGKLQQVTDGHEIESIRAATTSPLDPVRLHIKGALDCLAQRPEPDTRNAIKEAVSAVESAAKAITGNEKATFSALVQRLKADGAHPQFVEAWKNLYNYTSDSGGVRHGAKDGDRIPTVDEAKLFVITASAFTNYLAARYSPT